MEFIKILFNIAFSVLPLLLLLLLQSPAARTTRSEIKFKNAETTTEATTTTETTTTNSQTTTTFSSFKNKNNTTATTKTATATSLRELRKLKRIIDNSIDFTVDPCDDFYQYACGEWKYQLYDNDEDEIEEAAVETETETDAEGNQFEAVNSNNTIESDKYDRTLAMIDYLADKEVLKYFDMRNLTKNLNISSSPASSSSSSSSTTTTPTTTTTKEPDFIIKVYKYYKSCIAMQQYEPIKYLEWLELNEHVKWPSLINTTPTETKTTTTENSEEHGINKHDHHHTDLHNQQNDAKTTPQHQKDQKKKEDETIMDADNGAPEDDDILKYEAIQDYNVTWVNTLAVLRKYGLNGIFIEEIIYTTKSFPSKLILGFNKPLKEGGFKSLKSDHFKIILENLNVTLTERTFKDLWLKITKFEWELTKLNEISDDLGVNMITLEQLPVSWLNDYLRIIFNQSTSLDSNIRIFISNVEYFMTLDDLLNEYDDTFLNQYLQIRFLWHLYQQEPLEFQPLECLQHIKYFIPLAFEWIYEKQKNYLIQEIPKIEEIYSNLRKQFNVSLYNNKKSVDSSTLEKLVNKLESIQLKVGSFHDINSAEFFYENRQFYKQLKFSSREFYFNHLKILKFNFDALHFGLRTVSSNSIFYDMQEYFKGLSTAPHFNKRLNVLRIPLSLLQPPLYHPEFTDVYKYSSMGFILAQTLLYGFNVNDLQINEQGKVIQHFKCLNSLDILELNDRIADASGFRLAYHTFFHSSNKNLISNRKTFFLNFAQTFCASSHADDDLGRNPVNYALAQLTEFAKTFDCSPDSHMNPYEKCYLWD